MTLLQCPPSSRPPIDKEELTRAKEAEEQLVKVTFYGLKGTVLVDDRKGDTGASARARARERIESPNVQNPDKYCAHHCPSKSSTDRPIDRSTSRVPSPRFGLPSSEQQRQFDLVICVMHSDSYRCRVSILLKPAFPDAILQSTPKLKLQNHRGFIVKFDPVVCRCSVDHQ